MITRHDVIPGYEVSPELKALIERVGGKTPYGEPMFRVIRAEARVTQAAGCWNVWPEDASLDDRSGLGISTVQKMLQDGKSEQEISEFFESNLHKSPLKVVEGLNEYTPLYMMEGWILEKWKPAEHFGGQEEWTSFRYKGEASLGPYPYNGDYELVAGPTPHMLTAKQIEDAIRENFKAIDERPSTAMGRFMLLKAKREQRMKQKEQRIRDQIHAFVKDGPASLYNRLSLNANRVIQKLADDAGLKGHLGG